MNCRFVWRTKCDLTRTISKSGAVNHYDSCEYFHCCLDNESVSSVLFVPDSVIESCRPGELENMSSRIEAFQKREEISEKLGSGFVFVVEQPKAIFMSFDSFSLPRKMM